MDLEAPSTAVATVTCQGHTTGTSGPDSTLRPSGTRLRPLLPSSSRPKNIDVDPNRPPEDVNYKAVLVDDALAAVAKIPKQPRWLDQEVDPRDGKYFHFFLDHMDVVLAYSELFPRAISEIFARTTRSKALRHAVLCLSSLFVDQYLNRGLTRTLLHKQKTFASLQECLSEDQIDEELAIAIFLVLLMDVFQGKAVAHAHLQGLYLVLKRLHVDESADAPQYWSKVSPVLMLLWRIAIRLDSPVATIHDVLPVFPPLPASHNKHHRSWAVTLAKDGRCLDWAVAEFALDSCYQRANHYARQVGGLRASDEYFNDPIMRAATEGSYKERISELRQELREWYQQPAILYALHFESIAQQKGALPNTPTFLHYPALAIYDRRFICMLNHWRALNLFISFIAMPIALRRHTQSDLLRAIEYCRTHAALEIPPQGKQYVEGFFGLLTTGHTFRGGSIFQKEFEWCQARLDKMKASRHPMITQMQQFADLATKFRRFKEWEGFDIEEEDEIYDII